MSRMVLSNLIRNEKAEKWDGVWKWFKGYLPGLYGCIKPYVIVTESFLDYMMSYAININR
jgi:hypothetical protein